MLSHQDAVKLRKSLRRIVKGAQDALEVLDPQREDRDVEVSDEAPA